MKRYIVSRFFWAVVTVFGIVVVDFLITHILPGNPIDALVGDFPAPPEYIARVKHEFGLDQSLMLQLGHYLVNLAQGNLGYSFLNRQPVLALIVERAGNTLLLMVPSLVLASIVGVLIAVCAAGRVGSALDNLLTGVSLIGYSIPVFWLSRSSSSSLRSISAGCPRKACYPCVRQLKACPSCRAFSHIWCCPFLLLRFIILRLWPEWHGRALSRCWTRISC